MTWRIIVRLDSQPHFGDECGGLEKGTTCPFGALMIISTSLLLGTKIWGRLGGPRSSRGRIPTGQKKSVFRSVGSKILRTGGPAEGEEEVEGIEVEEGTGEEPSEDDTEVEVEEFEDKDSHSSSSSSSSSKTIEDRSIGGRAALSKQNFSQETGQVPKSKILPFLPKSTSFNEDESIF